MVRGEVHVAIIFKVKATSTPPSQQFPFMFKPLKKTCFSLFLHIETIYKIEQHALEMTLTQDLSSCRHYRAYGSLWEMQLQNQTSITLAQACTLKFQQISTKNWVALNKSIICTAVGQIFESSKIRPKAAQIMLLFRTTCFFVEIC